MRYLWYSIYVFVGSLAFYSLFFHRPDRIPEPTPEPAKTPLTVETPVSGGSTADVQIALLLDTSSSMDGLIHQARTQLWDIVSELQTDDNDQSRTVAVALYQYGNSRLEGADGFIQRLSPLTTELDAVSVKLHSLSTSGGKEYAPTAIFKAVTELDWSEDDSVQRVIVVAGNEGFNQGDVPAEKAMKAASDKGIKVLPIFCANGGATSTGLASWKRGADLAQTQLDTIDPDQRVAELETPYDAQIVEKYRQLQATRLTYGDPQYQQEIESLSSTADRYVSQQSLAVQASRAVAQTRQKAGLDLTVDYGRGVALDRIDPDQLPNRLRGLSKDQQERVIEQQRARRKALETEIVDLQKKRSAAQSAIEIEDAGMPAPSLGGSVRAKLR